MDNARRASGQLRRDSGRLPVDALASEVLSVVAKKSNLSDADQRKELVDRLCDAVRAFDPDVRVRLLAEFRALGVSDIDICEVLIPEAARLLGDDWCADRLGFADVTIGSARLQSMLRELSSAIDVNCEVADECPSFLTVVRGNEYHTLGALVLARHLRRRGATVKMALGLTDPEIAEMAARDSYDAVLISASGGEALETLRNLVRGIRKRSGGSTLICVGGTILEARKDVKKLTGADCATNLPDEVFRLCDLSVKKNGMVSRRTEFSL
ncbi:MAG: cobalamin-dependent protein [Pseudomonadota bacterium]